MHQKYKAGFWILFLLLISNVSANCQQANLSGTWTGNLTQGRKSYDMEMTLKQNGNKLSGTAYVDFGETNFAKFYISGTINKDEIRLYDLYVVDEKSPRNLYWCKKVYTASVITTGEGFTISGDWENEGKKMFSKKKLLVNSGINCVPGDFSVSMIYKHNEELADTVTKIVEKPRSPVIKQYPPSDPIAILSKPGKPRPLVTIERIEIISDSVVLRFYDNGTIDNDTISVYYNNSLILSKKRLSTEPLLISIPVERNKDNEVVMFADNEGQIPPNTALLKFEDNGILHEVRIRSDLKSSGAIYLYRKK